MVKSVRGVVTTIKKRPGKKAFLKQMFSSVSSHRFNGIIVSTACAIELFHFCLP